MSTYTFADLHCHPNLKTFGHSFRQKRGEWGQHHVWYYNPPTALTKAINRITGITKFSQADFTSLAKGGVRLAMVSLYPFEKGFFINGPLNGPLSAGLANLVTGIGFDRVRYLQTHTDYFKDLINEYAFLMNSCNSFEVDGNTWQWKFTASWQDVEKVLKQEHQIAVLPTIEGAHVFNLGLAPYGRLTDEEEVLQNIKAVKSWSNPPFFITLAHNFNNELCGHARSLERLGPLVNQSQNLDSGFSALGYKVVESLLSQQNGRRILIDVKHMSLKARLQLYELLNSAYGGSVPIIVSHGGVAGQSFKASAKALPGSAIFCADDINFYDEELVSIAQSGGKFALQLDSGRLAGRKYIKKSWLSAHPEETIRKSAGIVWAHLQHIAEVLDAHGLYAWGTATIGSDFDGTINPLEGIWTAECLPDLARALLGHAERYLSQSNSLSVAGNKYTSPEEVVERFIYRNAVELLQKHYTISGDGGEMVLQDQTGSGK